MQNPQLQKAIGNDLQKYVKQRLILYSSHKKIFFTQFQNDFFKITSKSEISKI